MAAELNTLGGPFADPISHFRAALMAAAMIVAVVTALLLPIWPPAVHKVTIELPTTQSGPSRTRTHDLDIMPDGSFWLDGSYQCDLIELRMALDMITAEEDLQVQVRPHPEARYEIVLELLAVAKRANARVRLSGEYHGPIRRAGAQGRRCRDTPLNL